MLKSKRINRNIWNNGLGTVGCANLVLSSIWCSIGYWVPVHILSQSDTGILGLYKHLDILVFNHATFFFFCLSENHGSFTKKIGNASSSYLVFNGWCRKSVINLFEPSTVSFERSHAMELYRLSWEQFSLEELIFLMVWLEIAVKFLEST